MQEWNLVVEMSGYIAHSFSEVVQLYGLIDSMYSKV